MLTRRTADPYPEKSRKTRELTWTGWLLINVRVRWWWKCEWFAVLQAEVGKQTLFKSLQIANPQILGPIPLSQIQKLRWANPQIANPRITTKYCTTLSLNIPKVVFLTDCFIQIWIKALFVILVRRKSMYSICWSLKPANHKKIGSTNRKSAKYHICGWSADLTKNICQKIFGFTIFGT
jgi:hypothetical protein